MDKKMKTICREIQSGKNLEVNLPQLFNRLITLYEQYAEIKLTMHYYTFYENSMESSGTRTLGEEEILKEFNTILNDFLFSDFSGEKMEANIKKLDTVRNEIIKQMNLLTAYTDIFQIYEYVLNRVEYRFKDDETNISDDEFAAEILRYIFDTKDNVIINDKIKEVIGQLPIRFTKNRYFDLLMDSLSIYKGADRSSLDRYIYMIKTSAMLYFPEGSNQVSEALTPLKKELEEVDYKNITKEQYEHYSKQIKEAAVKINDAVDFFYGLQECVNHLYVLLIASPYAYMEGGYRIESILGEMKFLLLPQDENMCMSILKDINNLFIKNSKEQVGEEIEEKLSYTEGRQEFLSQEFESLESYFSVVKSNNENMVDSLMLGTIYHCLTLSQELLGNSLFTKLNDIEDIQKVDEEYLFKVQEELLKDLTELFSSSSQYVSRAVMANTINKMPVFFQSTNDVLEYVKNSLEQCHDRSEKLACVDIIKSFFDN
jgi:hypothetical protein